jgi:signal transduction histidine kinase
MTAERERTGSARLELRGTLGEAELEVLCIELEDPEQPLAAVDLRGLESLEPATLATLATSLQRLDRMGAFPLDQVTAAGESCCLSEEGLAALRRPEGGAWHLDDGRGLLGWQTFSSGDGAQTAAFEVQARLGQHASWSRSSVQAMATIAFELAENVRQHSSSPGGVVALGIDKSRQLVKLAVADGGIGIPASLRRNPKFEDVDDDLMAVERAMRAGASGEPGTGGGMGLFFTRAMVRGNGGRILVRSANAKCEESDERKATRMLPRLHGTLVGIEARADRPLDDEAIRKRMRTLSGSGGVG